MMTLITGTPGAGKTLNTIKDVHQEVLKTPYFEKKGEDGIVEKYKREVYCCNVNGIDTEKSGFKILEDPRQWTTLPAGSILIIDEASDFYPTSKKFGEELEGDIAELRKHRHYGIDIYYITQQPGLINKNIRILCGLHKHYQRNFGGKTTICYSQNAVFETDSKYLKFAEQNGAKKDIVVLDKKYFSFYKSTEIDTHKSKLPLKQLFFKVILPVCVVILMIFLLFRSFFAKEQENLKSVPSSNQSQSVSMFNNQRTLSKDEYVDIQQPRLPFQLETAPIYDKVREVKDYPRIMGCFYKSNDKNSCECYTQQLTVYKMPAKLCLNHFELENRRFDFALENKR
ncbi:zonular occludens toxin domain-containing protein [Vibrio aestuarianus]|uniref:Assembly protein n=4 Tax=Vibrio aestuarianus TaxID=28171 RepID=A0ABN8TMH9_9VIBR|nr:zonular occludens toxin domain-containing protein [Vibrio aestuarianus]MDE1227200.1 zonular occludens toxin domain-containing protein [Vibrio aestuarianus]MDE1255300.1 zonular occludens toxin domain-containing protein [Vibrio aestuarianus]MDE1270108.1 zonular occludens toxin domain-containing protein [Vibrio aestuarianus]MDE1307743.1 zonular occludens toxin domain-containing protein [Vibrio aestuarianus]MDH5890787.1 zonular occludens toxin domain-containing protein [Vibrio aestuarianus]